jgi:hypothetical protein
MKTLICLSLTLLTACSSGSSGGAAGGERPLANFSVMYQTWTLPNNYQFEWTYGASTTTSTVVHSTDDFDGVNYCDCSVYGYGDATGGQVRLNSCTYRGNPSLSASKCTYAAGLSDFNFTSSGGTTSACFSTTNYQTCEVIY